MSRLRNCLLMCLLIGMLAPAALAGPEEAERAADKPAEKITSSFSIALVGACLGAAACVIGGGLAISRVGKACIEAIARQPEAAGSMFAPMIVAAAMIEGGMLFAIVVCLVGMMKL